MSPIIRVPGTWRNDRPRAVTLPLCARPQDSACVCISVRRTRAGYDDCNGSNYAANTGDALLPAIIKVEFSQRRPVKSQRQRASLAVGAAAKPPVEQQPTRSS